MLKTATTNPPPARAPYSYRTDAAVPAFDDDRPIIVFDGLCALCSGWAQFVLRFDRAKRFRLLTAQSPLGRAIYAHYGLDPADYETNILLADGRAWFKSEACLRMIEGLGMPWSMAGAVRALPLSWRDRAYGVLARNRLRIWGSRDTCYLPQPADRDRFLA